MQAFDTLFPDVAKAEGRILQTIDPDGRPAAFYFREQFCTEPGCDCRRVVFVVEHLEAAEIAAVLEYRLDDDPRKLRFSPGARQGPEADFLLEDFRGMLVRDTVYRRQLREHYTMWMAHPDHTRSPRAARATSKRTAKPAAPAGSLEIERIVAKADTKGSKGQQRFRRLLEKVDRLSRRLGMWKRQRAEIDREVALYHATFARHVKIGVELVASLDRAHAGNGLTKGERAKVRALICEVAELMIAQGGGDELKVIYNRHTHGDIDAERAAAEAEDAEELRAALEEKFGIVVDDEDAGTVEQLREAVRAQINEQDAEAAARRAKRKKTPKQAMAEARREDERKSADKAVQEVYRALARALHPDREQDPGEQARKTRLMSEVNIAYESKDLLRLLALQLELEQVDGARGETMAEERLQQFSRILDEQAKQLASELARVEAPFRMDLGVGQAAVLSPERVIIRIRADAVALEYQIERSVRDLATFSDLAALRAFLCPHPAPRPRSRADRAAAMRY